MLIKLISQNILFISRVMFAIYHLTEFKNQEKTFQNCYFIIAVTQDLSIKLFNMISRNWKLQQLYVCEKWIKSAQEMNIHLLKCSEKTAEAESLKKLINQSSSINLTSIVLKQIEVVKFTISYFTNNFMMKQIS